MSKQKYYSVKINNVWQSPEVSAAIGSLNDTIDELRAHIAATEAQEPAWKENALSLILGSEHKAYYLAAGAAPTCTSDIRELTAERDLALDTIKNKNQNIKILRAHIVVLETEIQNKNNLIKRWTAMYDAAVTLYDITNKL